MVLSLVLAVTLNAVPPVQGLVAAQKREVLRGKKTKQPVETAPQVDPVAAAQAKKDQELKAREEKLSEQHKELDAKAEALKAKEEELEAKKEEEARKKAAKRKAVENHAKENASQWSGAVDALGD